MCRVFGARLPTHSEHGHSSRVCSGPRRKWVRQVPFKRTNSYTRMELASTENGESTFGVKQSPDTGRNQRGRNALRHIESLNSQTRRTKLRNIRASFFLRRTAVPSRTSRLSSTSREDILVPARHSRMRQDKAGHFPSETAAGTPIPGITAVRLPTGATAAAVVDTESTKDAT